MDIFPTNITYVIGAVVSWILFYYVVKMAVKNGIQEACQNKASHSGHNHSDSQPTPAQIKLQQQYDNGEIPFDIYQSEWNRLQIKNRDKQFKC